jgi:hypothetical protein
MRLRFENIAHKLTIYLLCTNILAWIFGHNISGEKSLVRGASMLQNARIVRPVSGRDERSGYNAQLRYFPSDAECRAL